MAIGDGSLDGRLTGVTVLRMPVQPSPWIRRR